MLPFTLKTAHSQCENNFHYCYQLYFQMVTSVDLEALTIQANGTHPPQAEPPPQLTSSQQETSKQPLKVQDSLVTYHTFPIVDTTL